MWTHTSHRTKLQHWFDYEWFWKSPVCITKEISWHGNLGNQPFFRCIKNIFSGDDKKIFKVLYCIILWIKKCFPHIFFIIKDEDIEYQSTEHFKKYKMGIFFRDEEFKHNKYVIGKIQLYLGGLLWRISTVLIQGVKNVILDGLYPFTIFPHRCESSLHRIHYKGYIGYTIKYPTWSCMQYKSSYGNFFFQIITYLAYRAFHN